MLSDGCEEPSEGISIHVVRGVFRPQFAEGMSRAQRVVSPLEGMRSIHLPGGGCDFFFLGDHLSS